MSLALRYANAAPVFRAFMPPASKAKAAPPKGVTARAFSAGGLPTLQPVTAFALFFFLLVA